MKGLLFKAFELITKVKNKILLGKLYNFKLNVAEVKALLDQIDRNNDGQITVVELVTHLIGYAGKKAEK